MSHAANIRNRLRPDQPHLHTLKRRRTSEEHHSSTHKANGLLPLANGDLSKSKLSATPNRKAKSTGIAYPIETTAKIRPPDEEQDVDMVGSADDSDGVSSDEEVENGLEDNGYSDEDDDGGDGIDGFAERGAGSKALTNGAHVEGGSDSDAFVGDDKGVAEDEAEPSFGDMLRSRGQEPIDVQGLYTAENPAPSALATTMQDRTLSVPNAASLGTVLTQALRTNDVDLLESCFQVPNLDSIRATIERLHSSHATSLLRKLAERLHKRPGRAGSLMVWIQWTIVAHGGYLASQPAAMRELHILYQVVRQRATGLQPLLALKGKLDMLEAQMQLRRNMQAHRGQGPRNEVVTYVEGEESDSDAEDDPTAASVVSGSTKLLGRTPKTVPGADHTGSDDSDEDEMPTTLPNGVDLDDLHSDEDDGSDASDDQDLIDDEAEETDDDSDALSEEVDYDDLGDESEESDVEEVEPQPKPSKKARRA